LERTLEEKKSTAVYVYTENTAAQWQRRRPCEAELRKRASCTPSKRLMKPIGIAGTLGAAPTR